MKVKANIIGLIGLCAGWLGAVAQVHPYVVGDKYVKRFMAAEGRLNVKTAESSGGAPDVIFQLKVPVAGTYQLSTYAVPAPGLAAEKDEQGNVKTAYVKIQIDNQRPTRRILYDAHQAANQVSGKFELNGKNQQLKLWLPKGLELVHVEWKNYNDPEVPLAAKNYIPKIIPPAVHPRLWVTPQTLPMVKARLTEGENKPVWLQLAAVAKTPYPFDFNPEKEVFYQEELEKAVQVKAFYYLMTGDKRIGNEAVRLMVNYMSVLEFGNVKYGDITREIGRAIYTAALVYDWCYDLVDKNNRKLLYDKMLYQAREMEIGWPPFMDSIINGHGNEAQISRDLLSMAIALYEENPELYKYTAYTLFEHLIPMRKFEYESPRHNQGVDYGAYRFGWEMHAAWLLYRMSGTPVFDDNIKKLPYYWLYMRLPDGYMLRDGDMFSAKFGGARPLYWKQPQTMLLSYAYANDPLIKGEFEREGGLPDNPVLFLLVNDPALKAQHDLGSLPLTKDFGRVLGSMVVRTGWNNAETSKDVVAEIKGGGYIFGNHQQADAGALQIFHHGVQVGDIGLYLSYGSPYDYNFNKRSVAHSVMLAMDPSEPLLFRSKVRDGGARFNQRFPLTPEEVATDSWFSNGQVLSANFGPSELKPSFSYFKADLTAAYTAKMKSYTRGFCFLNLGREDIPAVVILTDHMTTAKPEFRKYWQINTLNRPEVSGNEMVLSNELRGLKGKTHVTMLLPAAGDRNMEILSGKEASSTFGQSFDLVSQKPEANAHRILVSPKKQQGQDRFLTVFQMAEGDAKPLPVDFQEKQGCWQLRVADRVVCLSSGADQLGDAFSVDVPEGGMFEVLLTDMKPGYWNVKRSDGKMSFNYCVTPGKNTLFFKTGQGNYVVEPGRVYGIEDLK